MPNVLQMRILAKRALQVHEVTGRSFAAMMFRPLDISSTYWTFCSYQWTLHPLCGRIAFSTVFIALTTCYRASAH